MVKFDRLEGGIISTSQQDPALSGNGEKLALIVDKNGRPLVQLRDLTTGQVIPLRYLSRHQPHSSPSLSWNARYLAVVGQLGKKRIPVIQDRMKGKHHKLLIPGNKIPMKVRLSPDASKVAIEYEEKSQRTIHLYDLNELFEPDLPLRLNRSSNLKKLNLQ